MLCYYGAAAYLKYVRYLYERKGSLGVTDAHNKELPITRLLEVTQSKWGAQKYTVDRS